jgi:hypothetical protein
MIKEKFWTNCVTVCIAQLGMFNFVLNQETKFEIINSTHKVIDQAEYQRINDAKDRTGHSNFFGMFFFRLNTIDTFHYFEK